ncbi:protein STRICTOSIDINE SYNTHASE-LIKE 5-like [Brassica napus]|uniref:protein STRICTOSIDINE SYNTHASE-LIKE 5-like n=1 Tax=Brassica napus TaxID=3708 RepID=UPI002078661A|nr:protein STRICTOSIDINE SYNTHASE-LIKE 5-like [Brassica napus]
MPLLFFSRRFLIFSTIIPFIASIALYRVDTFDPSHLPADALVYSTTSIPPLVNDQLLTGAEFIGVGLLNKPEDIAYDRDSGLIYTGCVDGWVKRVKVIESANDSVVEDWVNTGGRPLGLAFGLHGEVIVADAYKGLLNISDDGRKTELLTDEAEGVRFKLTDAVAVGDNGVLYFTDASYKYDYSQSSFDFLEGKPHGRLMSFNPTTRTTRVLLKNLYFANGVSMSPDQTHLVFCETPVSSFSTLYIISSLCAFIESSFQSCFLDVIRRRCSKYYISEERVEVFIENVLPGYPDNIRYDGDGHYWIAMPTGVTTLWKLSMRYPLLRKVTAMVAKWGFNLMFAEDAGVLQVDLDGNPIAFYHDQKITHLTTGVKIGKYLYCGSLLHSRILRLDLLKYLAQKSL